MEILNIGPLELIVIIIIMFVLLGPKEMIRTAYRIGVFIRSVVRSPMWKEIISYSQEIRELPQKLMEDTGLDDTLAEVKKSTQEAADEITNQIKEVQAAARVPEAEHVRLEAGEPQPSISPDAGAVVGIPAQVAAPVVEPASTPVSTTPEPAQAPAVGVPVGIPIEIPRRKKAALPMELALRPRRQRSAEAVVAATQAAPELAAAEPAALVPANGAAFASFAPRARRAQPVELAVIAATGGEGPLHGQHGANGNGASLAAQSAEDEISARMVPPVEETEPRDAAQ